MIIIESYGIGIGKTTLAAALAKRIRGSQVYHESVDHPYFDPFYEDVKNGTKPSHAAFAMQFHLMSDRYWKHLKATEYEWTTGLQTVHDRSIIGDHGFAHCMFKDGYITESDYQVYLQHRECMERQLLTPQIVIRLEASPETCLGRIKQRLIDRGDREGEVSITVEYLEKLRQSYEECVWPWFEKRNCFILEFSWEKYISISHILAQLHNYITFEENANV